MKKIIFIALFMFVASILQATPSPIECLKGDDVSFVQSLNMIKTSSQKYDSIKEIRDREKAEKEAKIKLMCVKLANEKYGEDLVKKWSNENQGLFFLPIISDDDSKIEAIGILRPINRGILSYASTKIADEGLYSFLEACMRECWIEGDTKILEEDEFFIPAANKFNAILEGKKAALLKR